MTQGAFQPRFEALPAIVPIFPLSGVLLLPGGHLPLNIFEPRYLNMTLDALGQGRMIGMIQPSEPEIPGGAPPKVYETGCLGRIVSFAETADGRLLITLEGVCRFRVALETEISPRGYRLVCPDYSPFRADMEGPEAPVDLDRKRLFKALKPYFTLHGLEVNWKAMEQAPDGALVTALATLCPLEGREKQALLEARDGAERARMLVTLLEMAILEAKSAVPGAGNQ